jgi:hypothetical protein
VGQWALFGAASVSERFLGQRKLSLY